MRLINLSCICWLCTELYYMHVRLYIYHQIDRKNDGKLAQKYVKNHLITTQL